MLICPNITVTGWPTRPEAVAKILEEDLLLFPTKWESLSIALLEVMYIGKPCIVSMADVNRDVIKNGENGYVCASKDDYLSEIKAFSENKGRCEVFSQKVHEDILSTYNVHAMEKRYRSLFDRIL